MNVRIISAIAVVTLLSGLSAVAIGEITEGAGPVTITDGTGRTFEYSEPTGRIITMGYASTLTVVMLGEIDKIIAVDKYSTYDYTKDERLKDLDVPELGFIYNASNNDYFMTTVVRWVEEEKMSLHDTIILTAYSNAIVLRGLLEAVGFDHVLVYLSITAYDKIVEFVENMSIIVTGEVSNIVDDMKLVKETIDKGLEGVTKKAKGLGVWYSASSGFSVGNTGSITVSLIEAAGGDNIAYIQSRGQTYGDKSTIVQLVGDNPDVVIFLPHSYTRDHSVSDFRNEVLGSDNSIVILPMEMNWNNYDPDAAEGLWAFACALYPDLFEGPAPHADDPSDSNLLLYTAAGAVAVISVLALAYFVMRKP